MNNIVLISVITYSPSSSTLSLDRDESTYYGASTEYGFIDFLGNLGRDEIERVQRPWMLQKGSVFLASAFARCQCDGQLISWH